MNFVQKVILSYKTIKNIPVMLLDYFGFLHGDISYTTRSGIKFTARAHTPDLAEIIVVASGYEYPLNICDDIKNSPLIIDIGAGIGDFALFAYKHFFSLHPKIYSFEPDKENFSYLKRNIIQNSANKSITISNHAIFSRKGKAYINTESKQNDEYTVSIDKKTNTVCKTITLFDVFKIYNITYVDIIKMDIEGSEYELLNHNKTLRLLKNHVKYLFIEFHHHHRYTKEWIIKKLEPLELIHKKNHVLIFKNKIMRICE